MALTGRYRKSIPEIDVEMAEEHCVVQQGEARVLGPDTPCCSGRTVRRHLSSETMVLDPVRLARRFVPGCDL